MPLFKVNNIPSLYVDPIDDFVNRLMVAEMLNIVGFHIPRAVATRNQEFWKVNFTLDDFDSNNIGHDPKIYSALRTEEDEIKTKRVIENPALLEEILDNLSPSDVRTLLISEDELSQANT